MKSEVDHQTFTKMIHKFHGGCSYCGVPKLSKIIAVLEKELKQGTSAKALEPELLELLDEMENVLRETKEYLA